METFITVPKADSALAIEITPVVDTNHNLTMLLSYEKIPTYRSFLYGKLMKDLPW